MDTTVDLLGGVLIETLRAAGYMESSIGQCEKNIRYLKVFITERGGGQVYTPALGAAFAADTVSPRTGRFSVQRRFDRRRLVTLFDGYLASGVVDLSVRKRGGGGPRPQASAFVELDTAWDADMAARPLALATRSAYARVARGYLVFLESCGITNLDDADGASVLAFMESLLDRWAPSSLHWVILNFRPFLKFTGRTDLVDALNLVRVRRTSRIVDLLSDAEQAAVVDACSGGVVTARDAAITLLALSAGLRACDIVNLRLGDIDWRSATVRIVQVKTGNPLTLPLPGGCCWPGWACTSWTSGQPAPTITCSCGSRHPTPRSAITPRSTASPPGSSVPQGWAGPTPAPVCYAIVPPPGW